MRISGYGIHPDGHAAAVKPKIVGWDSVYCTTTRHLGLILGPTCILYTDMIDQTVFFKYKNKKWQLLEK